MGPIRRYALISAAALTLASPTLSFAADATASRAAAPIEDSASMGDSTLLIALGVAAVILFFVLIADDDEDEPVSA
jgi:hypothetical protein